MTGTGTSEDGDEVVSHDYTFVCYSPIVDFYVLNPPLQ